MYAWTGVIFSTVVLVVAALNKADAAQFHHYIGGNAFTNLMFLLGASVFAFGLGQIAPSWSSARLAARWAAGCLAVVVTMLNIDVILPGRPAPMVAVEDAQIKSGIVDQPSTDIVQEAKQPGMVSSVEEATKYKREQMSEFEYRVSLEERRIENAPHTELPPGYTMQ